MNDGLEHELLRAKYRKLSDELPEQHKRKWLLAKKKLLKQDLEPKDWIDALEKFHEEIIHDELDKWERWREEEMRSWQTDNCPEGVEIYEHYKNQIEGYKNAKTLIQKINCIRNQTMQDMHLVFSYEDWERDR